MARTIDHLVVVTHDLSAAADAYTRLGFNVGRRNHHPWGTGNHIVQFGSSFFELLGFKPDFVSPDFDDPAFPFAGYLAGWAQPDRVGAAMMVLGSNAAAADSAAFSALGIGSSRMLSFSRAAQGPDGGDRTVAFTLAFAQAQSMPDVGFFVCQQHRPENFWNPAVQDHRNSAVAIKGLVLLADQPRLHADFLSSFADGSMLQQRPDWIAVETVGGRIDVMAPSCLVETYSLTLDPAPTSPCIVAAILAVSSVSSTRALLEGAGVAYRTWNDRLLVAPADAAGVALIFEA